MITGEPIIDTLVKVGLAALGVLLGGLLLLRGYRLLWLFSGVANFELALFGLNLLYQWFGIFDNVWVRAGIAVAVGVLGALTSRTRPVVAYGAIGFAVGGSIFFWVANILFARLPADESLYFWTIIIAIVIMLICLLMGALFAIRYDEVALILLSAATGVILITVSLVLNHQSEWEALLALSLGLGGVVVQYHDFLRDQRAIAQERTAEIISV